MNKLEIPPPFAGLVAGALDALDAYTIKREDGTVMKLSEKTTLFGQLLMIAAQFCADKMDEQEGKYG